jgi:hypothetical protein
MTTMVCTWVEFRFETYIKGVDHYAFLKYRYHVEKIQYAFRYY